MPPLRKGQVVKGQLREVKFGADYSVTRDLERTLNEWKEREAKTGGKNLTGILVMVDAGKNNEDYKVSIRPLGKTRHSEGLAMLDVAMQVCRDEMIAPGINEQETDHEE